MTRKAEPARPWYMVTRILAVPASRLTGECGRMVPAMLDECNEDSTPDGLAPCEGTRWRSLGGIVLCERCDAPTLPEWRPFD